MGVDRSTVTRMCRVAKQGALDALAASVRGMRLGRAVLARPVRVPETSSTSCDQVISVDQASDASVSSDAVLVEAGWFGQRFSGAASCRERCGRC